MKRMVRRKWIVWGEYGGSFTNLDEAKRCAREASKTPEYNYEATVYNDEDGMYYIDYKNGRCVRDGWSRPLKRTGQTGKFKLDGKIVEKPIYLLNDKECIRHNNQIIWVNR